MAAMLPACAAARVIRPDWSWQDRAKIANAPLSGDGFAKKQPRLSRYRPRGSVSSPRFHEGRSRFTISEWLPSRKAASASSRFAAAARVGVWPKLAVTRITMVRVRSFIGISPVGVQFAGMQLHGILMETLLPVWRGVGKIRLIGIASGGISDGDHATK